LIFTRTWVPAGETKVSFVIVPYLFITVDVEAVIFLIHGFGEHCGRYEHVAAKLNEDGYVGL
jgi:alpha-beta hydrolase superfamily lysophospholipase